MLIEEYEIKLPPNMKIISLPKNSEFSNSIASYKSTYSQESRTIYVTRKLVDLHPGLVLEPSQMPAVLEKSKAIARDLRAQIVYELK